MTWFIIYGTLIAVAIADALGFVLWYSCSWPRSQVLGPALMRGPAEEKRIAVTFDDGPLPPYTEQVLNILQSRNVTATFFVCGKDVEQHPAIVRRIHSEGHTIGNHTWSHPYLYFMRPAKIAEEIDRSQRAIHQATGYTPELFRPPYGARWFGLYPVLRKRGMHLVQWSVSGDDWKLKADAIVTAVCAGLSPGAVILMHDGRQKAGGFLQKLFEKNAATAKSSNPPPPQQPEVSAAETVKALPAIIDTALDMGYELVSVRDFFCGLSGSADTTMAK
jgi:peptidoglycan/xylan/chitin deacetylase (PgdA/CDA1 family)